MSSNYRGEEALAAAPIGGLMLRLAVPAVAAQLINMLYNIVDRIYIGHIPVVGKTALTGLGVSFPILMLVSAFAAFSGMGGAPLASIRLGAGDRKGAEQILGNSTTLLLGTAAVLTVFFSLFKRPLLMAFGASEDTVGYALEYLSIYLLGTVFVQLALGLNTFISAQGKALTSMLSVLIGAVLNIVLDPIFIFAFRWGMMGAAVATVLGQIVTAAMAVWYLCHMKTIELSRKSLRLDGTVVKRFLPLGVCSFLSQISLVAAMAAINNALQKYGAMDPIFGQAEYAQIPMAVVGIVMKFFQIIISVVIGMAAGCIPIVGYNIGAGRRDRARTLFYMLLAAEAVLGIAALLVVELLPRPLICLFGAANESRYYTEFAVKAFRVYLCLLPMACINKAAFIYLQALGKALLSTALSMVREVVFGVGFALLLPRIWGLNGVLWSMPVSDALTFLISAAAIFFTLRELSAKD